MEQEMKNTAQAEQQEQEQATAEQTANSGTEKASDTETVATTPDAVEVARLKAEIARLNTKADALATENANQKKELRSYKSAEQIREEERKEAEAAKDARLKELEKKIAISEISKSLMTVMNDDARASKTAEWLHGAEDASSVILEIRKLLDEQEKRLKVEYGKIPAPGVGGSDGPNYTKEQIDKMSYTERAKYASEHLEEYRRIMGR